MYLVTCARPLSPDGQFLHRPRRCQEARTLYICVFTYIHTCICMTNDEDRQQLDDDEDRQPTKTESRGQYRRREDQYLCIEIQPYRHLRKTVFARRSVSVSAVLEPITSNAVHMCVYVYIYIHIHAYACYKCKYRHLRKISFTRRC